MRLGKSQRSLLSTLLSFLLFASIGVVGIMSDPVVPVYVADRQATASTPVWGYAVFRSSADGLARVEFDGTGTELRVQVRDATSGRTVAAKTFSAEDAAQGTRVAFAFPPVPSSRDRRFEVKGAGLDISAFATAPSLVQRLSILADRVGTYAPGWARWPAFALSVVISLATMAVIVSALLQAALSSPTASSGRDQAVR